MKRSIDGNLKDCKGSKMDPKEVDLTDFAIGIGFKSYAEIEEAIQSFERKNFVQL